MPEPIVEIQSGRVRGVIEKHEDGFDYFAFKGIPYAETPTGELRFKDPVPKKPWTGIRDATKYGPICAQYELLAKVTSDEEDCLHLNVFTRQINEPNPNKAVFVWIHGGGFIFGCCNDIFNGPEYLIRKDIVLVTVHYRLGVFGFLDLEDEVAPGNQGLKDQVMALKWIKDNIHIFGGDPNNVTIAGESAGAASVHYLNVSPLSKGLFHKAILQSGVLFNPWSHIKNPREKAIMLCAQLGKQLEDTKKIFEFLKTVDAKTLREEQEKLRKSMVSFPFGPGTDEKSSNPFMPIPPEIAAEQGVQVPCLVGHTSREGLFFLHETSREVFFGAVDAHFEMVLQKFNGRIAGVLKKHNMSFQQLRRLYYKSERITDKNKDKFADIMSDLVFIEGIHRFVRVQSEKSSAPTYMYQLSYDPEQSLTKSLASDAPSGVGHFDDVSYLFKMRFLDQIGLEQPKKGSGRYRVMEQMTEMWTNFAKYGRPTIETTDLIPVYWQPIADGTVIRYLNIDEDLTMQATLNIDLKYSSASSIKI